MKPPTTALQPDVDPLARIPAPPHLSDRAAALWAEYAKPDRGNAWLALLRSGLEAMDRSDEATALLAAEGLTVISAGSGVAHVHPAVRIEKDARGQFAGIWRQLGLDMDERDPFVRIFSPTGA
jgi:phage terminase small subunit